MIPGERHVPDYRLYVDRRHGGEERWSLGPPKDALMRIPDRWLSCPIFFGGRDSSGRLHYRATAFLISTPTEHSEIGGICLVTARHNVLGALEVYGNVWVRLNTEDGGARDLEITEPWAYPDNPASDIAAIPFFPPFDWEAIPIPARWFVTDEVIETRVVGIGEELVLMGLFSQHVGKTRNLPIVRSGNLAAMPQEPLVDDASGEEYEAYLAEVRSIGGLSGSPVLLALNPSTRLNVFGADTPKDVGGLTFYLLGLIRGHWTQYAESDFQGTKAEDLNTGIAIITPITDVLPLLEREEFVRYRKGIDKQLAAERGRQVLDLAPEAAPDEARSEFERFQDLTRKIVAVPKKDLDEKRKDEG